MEKIYAFFKLVGLCTRPKRWLGECVGFGPAKINRFQGTDSRVCQVLCIVVCCVVADGVTPGYRGNGYGNHFCQTSCTKGAPYLLTRDQPSKSHRCLGERKAGKRNQGTMVMLRLISWRWRGVRCPCIIIPWTERNH